MEQQEERRRTRAFCAVAASSEREEPVCQRATEFAIRGGTESRFISAIGFFPSNVCGLQKNFSGLVAPNPRGTSRGGLRI